MTVLAGEIQRNRGVDSGQFEGYGTPNFVMLPRIFIRHQMQDLTEAELKVMLYIFDHTWGYTDGEGNRKDADAISRSQFLNGIRRLDGTQLDRGAGVSDRSLDRALDNLVKRGYIFRHRRVSASGRSDTNIYELNRYGKPCLTPALALPGDAATTINQLEEHVQAQAFIPTENIQKGLASENTKETPEIAKQNDNPRKFTPLPSRSIESTPANLRPSLPANLRPSTPANLPNTIENPNKEKIKQHTTQSNPLDNRRNSETILNSDNQVCVSSSSKENSEQISPFYRRPSASNNVTPVNPDLAKPDALKGPGEKVKAAKPVSSSQAPKDPTQAGLAADLLRAGVAKKEADNLAALAHQNGHSCDYVKQALQYIDRQRSVHNREGLLIHLVKTNWQPAFQEATGLGGTNSSGIGIPLPSANSIRPEHLPRLIEIEKRNLEEANCDFERETARARLVHFQTIAAQSQLNPNEISLKSVEEQKG